MPFDVIEIRRREDEREQALEQKFKPQRDIIPVILCNAQGEYRGADGLPLSAQVEGDPVRVWARTFGESPPGQFLNIRGVPAYTDIPAYAGYLDDSREMEIISVNVAEYTELVRELKERHALQHQPGGFDPLDVLLEMLVPLKITVGSGLNISIAPLGYEYGGSYVWFGGQNNFSLTASIPAAGLARYTLVYLDPADNTIKVVDGATGPDAKSFVPDQPAPPDDTYPAGWIRLAGGQTQLNQVSDVKEARLLLDRFNPATAGGGVWPDYDEIKVLTAGGTATTYTTMADAVAALTGGEVILIGPGTYTCNSRQMQLALAIIGSGMGVTELNTTVEAEVVWLNGPSHRVYMENITLRNGRITGSAKSVLTITNGSAILRNVELLNQITNANNNIGLAVLGSGGSYIIRMYHCIVSSLNSSNINYSIQNTHTTTTVYVEGGSTEGTISGHVRSQLQRHISGAIDSDVKGTSFDDNGQPKFGMNTPGTGQSIYWDGSKWAYMSSVVQIVQWHDSVGSSNQTITTTGSWVNVFNTFTFTITETKNVIIALRVQYEFHVSSANTLANWLFRGLLTPGSLTTTSADMAWPYESTTGLLGNSKHHEVKFQYPNLAAGTYTVQLQVNITTTANTPTLVINNSGRGHGLDDIIVFAY